MSISKDNFMSAMSKKERGVKIIKVGEPFNASIGIRLLTVKEREDLEMWSMQLRDPETGKIDIRGGRAEVLVRCLCDEKGIPLFSRAPEDMEFLQNLPAKQAEELLDECKDFNGLQDDPEIAKKMAQQQKEEAEKK